MLHVNLERIRFVAELLKLIFDEPVFRMRAFTQIVRQDRTALRGKCVKNNMRSRLDIRDADECMLRTEKTVDAFLCQILEFFEAVNGMIIRIAVAEDTAFEVCRKRRNRI